MKNESVNENNSLSLVGALSNDPLVVGELDVTLVVVPVNPAAGEVFAQVEHHVQHRLTEFRLALRKKTVSITEFKTLYWVTMVVRYYVLLTSFLKFLNIAQLFCHFCPILTRGLPYKKVHYKLPKVLVIVRVWDVPNSEFTFETSQTLGRLKRLFL